MTIVNVAKESYFCMNAKIWCDKVVKQVPVAENRERDETIGAKERRNGGHCPPVGTRRISQANYGDGIHTRRKGNFGARFPHARPCQV